VMKKGEEDGCRPARRPEEEFARRCIQQALGVPVCWHDDGSSSQPGVGMYDLAIEYPGRSAAVPVAVSSHIDSDAMETRNILSRKLTKGAWSATSLTQAWGLHTTSTPSLKELNATAEQRLAVLEAAGVTSFDLSTHQIRQITYRVRADADAHRVLDAEGALLKMGVQRASSYEPGSGGPMIHLYLDRGEWAWDGSPDAIVTWIDGFVADPDREDNLRQLGAAAQGEAHLAVFADMSVDGNVWRTLEDAGVIPTIAPTLVEPVTHLWLFADPPSSTGLAWDPRRGWYRFGACQPR
jgi:hypothetical protein